MPRERPRCMALTKGGDQCSNQAKAGSDYCGAHSGNAGRRSKLTRELITSLEKSIRLGAFWEDAAVAVGITRTTLYRWREQGEADLEHGRETLAAEFCDAITRASAAAEHDAARAVLMAGRWQDWRAAAWYLERRNPARWGKRLEVTHDGKVDVATPKEIVPESEEKRARILRVLADTGILEGAENTDQET